MAGGTAGCVIAARIAEARPDLSIIIIESGPDSAGNDEVQRVSLRSLLPCRRSVVRHDAEVNIEPLRGMFQALMGAKTGTFRDVTQA